MRAAVVIPVGPGRLDNLLLCLESLAAQKVVPDLLVMVGDGPEGTREAELALDQNRDHPIKDIEVVEAPKHEPGLDQPRNRGVRKVQEINYENAVLRWKRPQTHVWFLDSDLIVDPGAYAAFQTAHGQKEMHLQLREGQEAPGGLGHRIFVAPYDFMPPGERAPMPEYRQDMRWQSFEDHPSDEVLIEDLSAGLACFSGNLVWPIDQFVRVGGFWRELHHGRCEDGELGLRAVACGVPISFVAEARGWHLYHGGDPAPTGEWVEWATRINSIDVPKIDARHHWLHGEGLFVVEEDGKRFNVRCRCGWEGNTAEIWQHQGGCST